MPKKMTIHHQDKPVYDIVIERDFSSLIAKIQPLSHKYKKICIVSDTNVAAHYISTIQDILKQYTEQVILFVFNAGEESKTLAVVNDLYSTLISHHFDRADLLVALGGGVVGDLTGYAASTYLRGIDFIQIPTSLLAQVDSSIGGKTGVDFKQYKNMVGAFYHPKLVYMNLNALKSLPEREYLSGLAEVIKHGLIKDEKFYNWLTLHKNEIKALDIDILEEMIFKSCLIKKQVVEEDFTEKGDRALLNFGHTIGHAVEKLMNFRLLHGECVSIGISYALELSYKLNNITLTEKKTAIGLLTDFKLPVDYINLKKEDILNTILLDKKMESGILKFILLKNIGNAVIDRSINISQISDLLHEETTENDNEKIY